MAGWRDPYPAGEDGVQNPRAAAIDIQDAAYEQGSEGADRLDLLTQDYFDKPTDGEFLQLIRECEAQASLYTNEVNRKSWAKTYHAFHQEHFHQSKYLSDEYRGRSKLFIPKTRAAVRKDLAAVAASLFGSLDAVNCMAGDEGNPEQRASAAVIQELLNYRTDRTSGKASIPWFHIALGARQTSQLTGICLSKQSWLLELRMEGQEDYNDEETGESGKRDVWVPWIDRPNCELIPPENFLIDPAADWTNPAQNSSYVVIKWPMTIDQIRRKQNDPRMPWRQVSEERLRSMSNNSQVEQQAIRRAREQGLDRFDETQTGRTFEIIWVYETFVRTAGEDWTYLSLGTHELLTDPKPVREVYPEQHGERPLTFGYGSFEAFRIFPMSNAESWQMLQQEANDLRNLTLDALKQNIMPVTKVVRGRQVDLEQLRRRGQGTAIMVNSKDDVTWEQPPNVAPQAAQLMQQAIDVEFDDLAGNQNYGTVQQSNSLGRTLGGLKLAAGAANAVQEFDIRVWIETWTEPTLAQIVRLEQYYESDPIILGLCGTRAKLMQKYGINEITNALLENDITTRVNIGLGAGDPAQRLEKFSTATQIFLPLAQMSPDFQSGKKTMDLEAIMQEIYGGAGYRDGGKRFIKDGEAKSNPMQQPEIDNIVAKTQLARAQAKKAILDALSGAAKVGLDTKELELATAMAFFDRSHRHMGQIGDAMNMGHDHAERLHQRKLAAAGLGPDGAPLSPPGESIPSADAGGLDESGMPAAAAGAPAAPPMEGAPPVAPPGGPAGPAGAPPPAPEMATPPPPQRISINSIRRDPQTGRIVGADITRH